MMQISMSNDRICREAVVESAQLTQDAFLGSEESSFSFYKILPSDNVRLEPDWPSLNLIHVAQNIQFLEGGSADEVSIDMLSCALLKHGANPLPQGVDWTSLAGQVSIQYMRQFKRDGNRRLKMKAQRANFFLRDLIDLKLDESANVLARRSLSDVFPWDWLLFEDGEVIVDSSTGLNVRFRRTSDKEIGFRLGLPTQIDLLSKRRLAISSCYSNGWWDWDLDSEPVWRPHSWPVVLAFTHEGDTYCLDSKGALFLFGSELPLLRLPVTTAWRARLVDGRIFVSELSEPRRLTVLDTDGWQVSVIDGGPVLLLNDLCKVGETYYAIDKMQGSVFSYDANFVPKGRRLSFGKGFGCLYDPIALRFERDTLCVLSWLTGALTEISLF